VERLLDRPPWFSDPGRYRLFLPPLASFRTAVFQLLICLPQNLREVSSETGAFQKELWKRHRVELPSLCAPLAFWRLPAVSVLAGERDVALGIKQRNADPTAHEVVGNDVIRACSQRLSASISHRGGGHDGCLPGAHAVCRNVLSFCQDAPYRVFLVLVESALAQHGAFCRGTSVRAVITCAGADC